MDESWIRTFPYEQQADPGDVVSLEVVITNHSTEPCDASARPVMPRSWGQAPDDWQSISAPAKAETPLTLRFEIPAQTRPGRYPIPLDVRYGERLLPQFTETVIVVK